jgi:CSLREA domain-containing protein
MRLPVTSQRKAAFRAFAITVFVACLAVCLAALMTPPAAAGPRAPLAAMTVNTLDDEVNSDGDCSLREAIQAANTDLAVDACPAGSDADTITFDPALVAGGPQTLTLSLFDTGLDADESGPTALDVTAAITLTGPGGENGLTLQRDGGGPAFRLFRVSLEGELTLENLTLRGGLARGGDGAKRGGGAAGLGGAIYNEGILRLVACTLTGNQASGGNGAYGYDNDGGGGGAWGPTAGTARTRIPAGTAVLAAAAAARAALAKRSAVFNRDQSGSESSGTGSRANRRASLSATLGLLLFK